jgi:glycosyltransferase involved in cell wall biosynthesis
MFKVLHDRFPEATFVLIGRLSHSSVSDLIRTRAQELQLPLTVHIDATEEVKEEVLGSSRFYLHAKQFEHFGIALVEALALGCIPFVHNSGGQVEIVTPEILRYTSGDELPEKVAQLCSSASARQEIYRNLSAKLASLQPNGFVECIGKVLNGRVGATSFEDKEE